MESYLWRAKLLRGGNSGIFVKVRDKELASRLRIGVCGTRINSLDIEEKKAQHRFVGKAREGQLDTRRAATFDLSTGKEVIP